VAVAIRRPIAERADGCGVRPPDPAEVVGEGPVAVSVEILCAPNIFVVILDVVFESLSEKLLTFANPIIYCIA
jgi:hypothetical protein